MSENESWASTIGLFILNFSTLDLHIKDYLENNLSPEEFGRFKDRHFQDRIECIQKHVQQPGFAPEKREEFERLLPRLEPVREIRNHIAHGLLRLSWAEDKKDYVATISRPRDLDGSNSQQARHLTFEELLRASTQLTELIEDFKKWDGKWVTNLENQV